jgi:nucleotide-binding universal stress UspA family protein
MDRILVGVDGSSSSTDAAVWAAGEAVMRNIELTIVHVVAPLSEGDTQTSWPANSLGGEETNVVVAQGAEVIDDALNAVIKENRQPPRITCNLRFGSVMPALWEFTQEGAQMIVLGRHGRGETREAGLGSVTDEMLQTARCPVTVVPHEPVSPTQAGRAPVVVGVNTSPASQLAIAVAFDEAARRKTQLVAVHAVAPAYRSAASGSNAVLGAEYVWAHALADWQLRSPNVDVRCLVTPDDPVHALLKYSRHAQLLVVGGGRRSGVVAKPFGAVSSAVARAGRIPVVVARRKPTVRPLETIGNLRKTGRPRRIR